MELARIYWDEQGGGLVVSLSPRNAKTAFAAIAERMDAMYSAERGTEVPVPVHFMIATSEIVSRLTTGVAEAPETKGGDRDASAAVMAAPDKLGGSAKAQGGAQSAEKTPVSRQRLFGGGR